MLSEDSTPREPEDDLDELDDELEDETEDEFDDAEDADEGDEDPEDQQAVAATSANGPSPQVAELAAFVEYMVSALVDDPSVLQVRPEQFGPNVHIKVIVPEEEMGKVIGRQGRIARSMRTLLTIAASRKGLRASLDIDS